MAAPPLLTLQGIALTFGGTPLLSGADLALAPGDRTCLVGRNGSGKSTLLKVAAGLVEPDKGVRFLQPGTTVRYLAQEPDFSGHATTLSFVEAGMGPGDEMYRARYLLESLGLTGEEDPSRLSGGESRRAALAQALAPEPDILLLDEPTNHLDLPAIEWLEAELKGSRSALVLISHDRRFLEALSRSTVWLDRGTTRRLDQGFFRLRGLARPGVRGGGARPPQARSQDRRGRGLAALRRDGAAQAQRQAARRPARPAPPGPRASWARRRRDPDGERDRGLRRPGGRGARRRQILRRAPDRPRPQLAHRRRDRLGIVGANGTGKTTLVNLLTGRLPPDSGEVKVGANVTLNLLDQRRSALDPERTVADVLTGGGSDTVQVGGQSRHVIGYMKDFLFSPEQARTPVGVLSGGERNRLLLARALAEAGNLLVLDEPTNDLDLETLDLLQEMLGDYAGTLILVSHDRDFLDRVVDTVLVSEGEGRWIAYAGGYSDMVAQRGVGVQARGVVAPKGTAKDAVKDAVKNPAKPAARPDARKRLGFNEQHELKTLPARMKALEGNRAKLRAALDDPTLYARDPARFEAISRTLATTEADLAGAEERWLELEMMREELEG